MCANCGNTSRDSILGAWCDTCGGYFPKKGQPLFRHVATADGPGGRLPICFDYSTADYCVAWEREIKQFVKYKKDWVQSKKTYISHGSLDAVLAKASEEASGPDVAPELTVAPSATREEQEIVNL